MHGAILISYNVFVFCCGSKASQVPACLIFTYISLARPGSPVPEKISTLGGHVYTRSQTRSPRPDLPGNHSPFQRAWAGCLGVQFLLGHSCRWELLNAQPLVSDHSSTQWNVRPFDNTVSTLGARSWILNSAPTQRTGSSLGDRLVLNLEQGQHEVGLGHLVPERWMCSKISWAIETSKSIMTVIEHKEQYMWPILIIRKRK